MTKKSDIVEIEDALNEASGKAQRSSINTKMLKKFALFSPPHPAGCNRPLSLFYS